MQKVQIRAKLESETKKLGRSLQSIRGSAINTEATNTEAGGESDAAARNAETLRQAGEARRAAADAAQAQYAEKMRSEVRCILGCVPASRVGVDIFLPHSVFLCSDIPIWLSLRQQTEARQRRQEEESYEASAYQQEKLRQHLEKQRQRDADARARAQSPTESQQQQPTGKEEL